MRHGPDAQSVFAAFAAAFLVKVISTIVSPPVFDIFRKLLQPKYTPVFTQEQRQESYNLIQRVIDALGSPEVAIDDKHGPKLYSRLLTGLLATVKLDASHPGRRPPSRTRKPSSKNSSSFTSNTTSPSRSSLSPIVPNVHLNVNQVQQIQMEEGHGSPGDVSSGSSPSSMKGLNVQEFFAPPLPFDGELLHSMQDLTNSTEWEGMVLPGAHCLLRIDVFLILIVLIWFLRMELDGRFTTIQRNATGCTTARRFPSTPCAECIYDCWGLFHSRFPKVLRSGKSLCCGSWWRYMVI